MACFEPFIMPFPTRITAFFVLSLRTLVFFSLIISISLLLHTPFIVSTSCLVNRTFLSLLSSNLRWLVVYALMDFIFTYGLHDCCLKYEDIQDVLSRNHPHKLTTGIM
ncbi:hypothetical protein K435DRAFT_130235 [Dendrothele bispora CBS 962.96]|uniref:Uncharacterized protein n=1 Tax=Dendrothele bispora (strain CBS 962.96) TaxID=1314807 RepID=A0A4S8M018_DENBC|nr:hypothetical protein K435DRAFT_130235 [Dendrothele bispora CBS 962.96]